MSAGVTTTFSITSATGWPDGSDGPFYVVVDPTTDPTNPNSLEEKIRCSSRTGTTITIASSGRGADGTSDVTHASGARVWHVFTSVDADEANYAVNETVGKVTTAGDLLVADGVNSLTRHAKGANSTFFGVDDSGIQAYRKVAAADVAADIATQAELDAHAADTTSVHGIADTTALVVDGDAAGGDLTGTYPNPTLGVGVVDASNVAADVATQAEIDLKADLNLTLNAQTGTTYTLVLSDNGKLVTLSNAAAITLTVPPNSSVAFPTGATVLLAQIGAGQVTIAAGVGVTVNGTPTLKARAQYSSMALIKTATDTWLLVGDLATT